jgi:hypothetical protein
LATNRRGSHPAQRKGGPERLASTGFKATGTPESADTGNAVARSRNEPPGIAAVVWASGIAKKDAGQLGQSASWFEGPGIRLPNVFRSLFTPNACSGRALVSLTECALLIPLHWINSVKNLRAFAKQLANPDVAANASDVAKRLGQFEFNGDAFVKAFSAPVQA